ncbi:MAG: type II secretion system protein, partial [Candidatus Delongbacteria bacterium]|nr:type II secretion system protein [Candidatus Delongbacteria bacterium]
MKKGMTLIELLAASLILTIGTTGLLVSFVTCMKIINRNTNELNATILVNQLFEGIQRRTSELSVQEFIEANSTGFPVTDDDMPDKVYYLKWDTTTMLN